MTGDEVFNFMGWYILILMICGIICFKLSYWWAERKHKNKKPGRYLNLEEGPMNKGGINRGPITERPDPPKSFSPQEKKCSISMLMDVCSECEDKLMPDEMISDECETCAVALLMDKIEEDK